MTISVGEGVINNLNYEGTHDIKVVGKNANKYNSVDVKVFTIEFVNPCPTSTINPGTINPMTVTAFGAKEMQEYTAFTDSVSSNNGGDGYNYCGTRKHYVRLPTGGEVSYMTEYGL